MSVISDNIRKSFKEGDDKRDAGLTTPDFVERFDDILYGSDEKWQVLDVYRPKKSETKKHPVIVSVHGGGWVYGDKERYQYYCMSLVEHGFAVVNFTYRLAPEFKFPAAIEDLNLVLEWMAKNCEKYGLDIENVFAVGDSAGAHQLGLYAGIYTNEEYAAKYDFKVASEIKLKAICLNCGAYKVDMSNKESLDVALMADYLENKGNDEEMWMINVAEHVTEKYLPTLYMTCTGDFLKEQAPVLEKVLLEKNVPHEFHYFGDSDHELGHVFHLNIKSEIAHQCNKIECEYFKRFL